MPNPRLFNTRGQVQSADTTNDEGRPAYELQKKHALAQYAVTECFGGTFYADEFEQLDRLQTLSAEVDSEFIAKLAIYSREVAFMKDMPAYLCAILHARDMKESRELLRQIFPMVINNVKMLRNFVQIVRSGVLGRRSFGTATKRLIANWINNVPPGVLFRQSVGQDPSLADIIKMIHPKPTDEVRRALYAYLIGREYDEEALPRLVRQYEDFKNGKDETPPAVEFRQLTSLPLTKDHWNQIALDGGWHMVRMNLNTFERHGCFKDQWVVDAVADKLRNPGLIERARVFPYQIMTAYKYYNGNRRIKEALQDAMEIATSQVPSFGDRMVYVAVDTSGSMTFCPVTGRREPRTTHGRGSDTVVRPIDVASLVASCILRKNPTAEVIPFAEGVKQLKLNPRDTVLTNAEKLAALGGGGTNCSSVLQLLNQSKAKGDVVIYISDNQSWMDNRVQNMYNRRDSGTAMLQEWQQFKRRNSGAKLICLDTSAHNNSQVPEREDVLNIGGFSDKVFKLMNSFVDNGLHFVDIIEGISLHK